MTQVPNTLAEVSSTSVKRMEEIAEECGWDEIAHDARKVRIAKKTGEVSQK